MEIIEYKNGSYVFNYHYEQYFNMLLSSYSKEDIEFIKKYIYYFIYDEYVYRVNRGLNKTVSWVRYMLLGLDRRVRSVDMVRLKDSYDRGLRYEELDKDLRYKFSISGYKILGDVGCYKGKLFISLGYSIGKKDIEWFRSYLDKDIRGSLRLYCQTYVNIV